MKCSLEWGRVKQCVYCSEKGWVAIPTCILQHLPVRSTVTWAICTYVPNCVCISAWLRSAYVCTIHVRWRNLPKHLKHNPHSQVGWSGRKGYVCVPPFRFAGNYSVISLSRGDFVIHMVADILIPRLPTECLIENITSTEKSRNVHPTTQPPQTPYDNNLNTEIAR